MKKIVYAALATLSGLVLLFSYRTSLGTEAPSLASADTVPAADPTSPAHQSAAAPSAAAPSSSAPSTTARSGLKDGSYTGGAVNTRYGAVQVRVTISGGRITAVDVPQYPDGEARDLQINQRAIPKLVSETLAAQSSRIDLVSGATYTSDGYQQSLQSALDEAAT
ncbi:FMN-binding protein [Microbacterium sp. X-17]|uniref:FMN-binding protein n=1 Tax=Microbacterium sp. X-17 TaxID=3144404 RepID=UPI0031F4B0C8